MVVAGLALAGCVATPQEGGDPVVVGVGSRAEQEVLGAVTAAALERSEIPFEMRTGLGDTVGLRREATSERIDLFWDYTGAAWVLGLREQAPVADAAESWERVREADAVNGLEWLPPTEADATFALAIREDDEPIEGDATMSWLAGELSSGERSLCADVEFLVRPGGLEALAEEYAIDLERLPRQPADDEEQVVEAVADGRCFAGLVTATSGEAHAAGLVTVADDLGVLPAFVAAPVVRGGSPGDGDDVAAALAPVIEALDTATLARLNAERVDGEASEVLAERFLEEVLGASAMAAELTWGRLGRTVW